jgi:hypothetical protein
MAAVFELRASCLLGRYSYCLSSTRSSSTSYSFFLEFKVDENAKVSIPHFSCWPLLKVSHWPNRYIFYALLKLCFIKVCVWVI